jgi:uncharacterized protein YjdB
LATGVFLDDPNTIPTTTKIIASNSSTAKTYATKYHRAFEAISSSTTTTATLQSIAITTPASKLSYSIGNKLDITGLVVTGTYSNGSTKTESISASNITGFNSATAAVNQVLTITDGTRTTTYKVQITTASNTLTKVTGVSLNKSSSAISVGSSDTLIATIAPTNASNKNVTWKSSNTAVATVDSTGKVVGLKAGTAIVTVTTVDKSKTATCTVTVSAAASTQKISVTGVSLNKNSSTLSVGSTDKLIATITPANATNKKVTWKSSNTN